MTRLLAIETSSQACSVALAIDGSVIEQYEVMPKRHAQSLLPMIHTVLAEAACELSSLDAIAFARGPGSFTGIRIATSVAQGLAFGVDLPLVSVSTLAALAQTVYRQYQNEQIIAVLDARMKEIYWGCYQANSGCVELVEKEHMTCPEMLQPQIAFESRKRWVGVGDGWGEGIALPDLLRQKIKHVYNPCYPHAQDVLRLAQRDFSYGLLLSPELAQPTYMRDKTAWRKSPKYSEH